MRVSTIASTFFLIYGGLILLLADQFSAQNPWTCLFMVASCLLIAILLRTGRLVYLNLLISIYVFKVYLTRPSVDMFLAELNTDQLIYVASLNNYFLPRDAEVVYCSLFTLLLGWTMGLLCAGRQSVVRKARIPKIFDRVDQVVARNDIAFWIVWILLSTLNHQSATENWQGIVSGEGTPLFAYGVLSVATINIICLYAYIRCKQPGNTAVSILLILPVVASSVLGTAHGGRSAVFNACVLAGSYLIFLNYDRRFGFPRIIALGATVLALSTIVMFGGLVAQSLRPLLMYGADTELIAATLLGNLSFWEPENTLINDIYFGTTQLLLRASSLEQPFLILNDHFVHEPWDYFNPLAAAARLVNDLLPGEPFQILSINQVFSYIYLDHVPTYRSDMWSIQGTLYLYFGLWLSPLIVFVVAIVVAQAGRGFDLALSSSPALAVFTTLLVNDLIENGTIERILVVDVVRPLVSFFGFLILYRIIGSPLPRRVSVPSRSTRA